MSFAILEGAFGVGLVAAMLVTWPDAPWNAVLVVALLFTLIVPYLVSPWTRTIWVALDRALISQPDQPEPPPPWHAGASEDD